MATKDLIRRRELLPSVFSDFFRPWESFFDSNGGSLFNNLNPISVPSVNISENKDRYEVSLAAPGMKKEDFLKKGIITQIGYPPLRIDILNEIDGVDFKDAYDHKSIIDIDGLMINYIGLDDLIKNKTSSGRQQDLTDVNSLKKLKKKL